ncbi:MAG: tetraacyldisaccharide 4'-kinase [Mesorhizobium sp.]|nr:MAG: tetraacyldisaccharide 4'-kinase [Mesorhizobium sp.]
MTSEAPPFWWEEPDWRVLALSPLSAAYALLAGRRMRHAPREKVEAPVLCVGNFTVGGSGKTPNRAAGARLLMEKLGCDFLIMDDGFQSARLHIDFALVVVDTRYGIGNGRVIPGGPLRANIVDQLVFTSALLKMGEGTAADPVVRQAARAGRPIFEAHTEPRARERFAGKRFLAFAGIGHPEKFFGTLRQAGGDVVLAKSFPDHHFYAEDELAELAATAKRDGLRLVTTAKDAARLRHGASQEFLDQLEVLEIDAVFELDHVPERIIDETLDAWRQRKLRR